MPGLVPGISLSQTRRTLGERVDGRDKPGHDVLGFPAMHTNFSIRTLEHNASATPLHNLIEFKPDQFESTLWRVIQSRPFQRLRRIRQLGFSELVFPGATHTRFAHSIGVFHTARNLMATIERTIDSPVQDGDYKDTLT